MQMNLTEPSAPPLILGSLLDATEGIYPNANFPSEQDLFHPPTQLTHRDNLAEVAHQRVNQYLTALDMTALQIEQIISSAFVYYPQAFDSQMKNYLFDAEQIHFLHKKMNFNFQYSDLPCEQLVEIINQVSERQRISNRTTNIGSDIRAVLQSLASKSFQLIWEENVALKQSVTQLKQQLMIVQLKLQQMSQECEQKSWTPTCSNITKDRVSCKQSIELFIKHLGHIDRPANDDGDTILHAICYYGDENVLKWFLMSMSPCLDIRNSQKQTALDVAVHIHNISIALLLIGNGAILSVESRKTLVNDLVTMSDKKAKKILTKSIRLCIDCDKSSKVNVVDRYQMTPLHWAVILHLNNSIKWMLNISQLRFNERDCNGHTPLICAARVGNEEAMDLLLSNRKIDLTIQDLHGDTALHHYMRYIFSFERNKIDNEFVNPFFLLTGKVGKWFQITPYMIPEIVLYNAGSRELTETYHTFLVHCLNRIAASDYLFEILDNGDDVNYLDDLNIDHGFLEGFIEADIIKRCLLLSIRNRLKHPQLYRNKTQFYRGLGFSYKLRCLSLFGKSNKETDWCLMITGYGNPNKNIREFETIMKAGGRIFYINGKSVFRLVVKYNEQLVKQYGGSVSRAKKDHRWNSGAHHALRSCQGDVTFRYGSTFKKLEEITLKQQLIGMNCSTYEFTLRDIEAWRDPTHAIWIKNRSKMTPIQLAQEQAHILDKMGLTKKPYKFIL